MRDKVANLIGDIAELVNWGTSHSVCNKLIKENCKTVTEIIGNGKEIWLGKDYRIAEPGEIIRSIKFDPEFSKFLKVTDGFDNVFAKLLS